MFGPFDSLTMHYKLSYCYGFIQYKSVYSAAAALRYQHHIVRGMRVRVLVADSWHQPGSQDDNAAQNDSIETESDVSDKQGLQFMNLNDDCLYEILSHLSFFDLSSMDQTCVRLQQLSRDVFHKRHTALNLTDTTLCGYSNVGANSLTLLQIRNLLSCFGPQIAKLKIGAISFKTENRSRVLDLVVRHCTTLKHLCLTGFYIKDSLHRSSSAFFSNLEELSLSLCEINDSIRRIFMQCEKLRKLTIQSHSNLTGSCLAFAFPSLESISLVLNSDIKTRHLYTFFRLNPQLKSVKLVKCGGSIFDEIFPIIANHLPLLESLVIEVEFFHNFTKNLGALLKLDHLRELQLNCSMYSISHFVEGLAAKDKIEILHLSDGLLNENLIDAIVKCKRLTSLKLCSMPSVQNRFLVELAKNLHELKDFHISKCQSLNSFSSGVLQFVDLAKNLETLNLTNSSVDIDDKFFECLVQIYESRKRKLTLNLNRMITKITPKLLEDKKDVVEIVRPIDVFLCEIYGDDFSDSSNDDFFDDGMYSRLPKNDMKINLLMEIISFSFDQMMMTNGRSSAAMQIYSMMITISMVITFSISTSTISILLRCCAFQRSIHFIHLSQKKKK